MAPPPTTGQASNLADLRDAVGDGRLRDVVEHYASTSSPARVVGAAALFYANKVVSDRYEGALAPLKLTKARFEILGLLDSSPDGRLTLRHLTRVTMHHPATMTYTIDALEKVKLVKRRPDPSDRRGVLAEITAAGRKLVGEAERALEAIGWGLDELDDDAATRIAAALSSIRPG